MSTTITRREFGAATAGTAAAIAGYDDTLYARMSTADDGGNEHVFRGGRQDNGYNGYGDRIRDAREARGLTIEQCAHAIDERNANFWYAHWDWLEQGGEFDGPLFMQLWPTVEALLSVPITMLLYGGSELALAKRQAHQRLQTFQANADIKPDLQVCDIGNRIKAAREWRGLSIAEAASKADCTERDWQRFENGGFPPGLAETWPIIKTLDVDIGWLLVGEPDGDGREIPPAA
jgi:transcriptional regulator with XRE-family HTH domain